MGGLLVLRVPAIMPWNVTPELSTLFGFMFLGAAAYFAFGPATGSHPARVAAA